RAAALHVHQDGDTCFDAGASLDRFCEPRADPSRGQPRMAKLIDLGGGLRFNAFYPRTLRDDDDAEAPGFHPLLYMAYDTVERHGLFGDEDQIRAAGDPTGHGEPASVAAHCFDDHNAAMRLGGRVKPIERLTNDPDS